jgi:hypothetical protein
MRGINNNNNNNNNKKERWEYISFGHSTPLHKIEEGAIHKYIYIYFFLMLYNYGK